MSANHYGEMMLRRRIAARWEHFFADRDFLIRPVAFGSAYARTKVGSRLSYDGTKMIYGDDVWPFRGLFQRFRASGPAGPTGLGKEGLPLGVQIASPYWSEPEIPSYL